MTQLKESMKEGYIKFTCKWTEIPVKVPETVAAGIIKWRQLFYSLELIGADMTGTGFGNISAREPRDKIFFITGSATGKFPEITTGHLARVDRYDIKQNLVYCTGEVRASAETFTHAAIYESAPETNGIIHIHDNRYWKYLLGRVPATSGKAAYGTPAMAFEIKELFRDPAVMKKKVIVMEGHPDGIITFGKDLDDAGAVLLAYINHIESL